jgi:integrase/recombinase XerD
MYDLDHFSTWMHSWGAAETTHDERLKFARRIATTWPNPATVTDSDLQLLLADDTYSTWTRLTYLAHLRSLFGWLTETGRIDLDPTIGLRRPKHPTGRPRPLTVLETQRARAAAPDDLRALLLLGLFAGLRAHEAAKIHSRDVSQTGLFVVGKGGREDVLPTHPLIWAEAQRRDGYWFPGGHGGVHLTSRRVSTRTTELFASLGIEGSFHRCRHFYGTQLLRAGVNIRVVQTLMRHASLSTTAAYLGVDEDEKTAAIALLAA